MSDDPTKHPSWGEWDGPWPRNKKEARLWAREHFAKYIEQSDGGCPGTDLSLQEAYSDEVQRIAARLRKA